MVFFNYSTMQMAAKVVYYGPGLCGKTTNLTHIYTKTSDTSRGEMVSLETETDRTLFFDLLPIDVGQISGFSTRIQLYTVPGQVFYNTTRKLVLKGVDGVVFVADSQRAMRQANIESFQNLEENLQEMGLSVYSIPLVLQYNKRDLPDILTVEELEEALNECDWPAYEASAVHGQGVFETLKGISKLTLMSLRQRLARDGEAEVVSPAAATSTVAPPKQPPKASPKPAAKAAPKASRPQLKDRDVLGELDQLRKAALAKPSGKKAAKAAPAKAPPPAAKAPAPPPAKAAAPPQKAAPPPPRKPAAPTPSFGPTPEPSSNGLGELHRSLALTLKRADFERVRRVTLSLQVEDGDSNVVDAVRGLHIDLENPSELEKLLLRLRIALQARE